MTDTHADTLDAKLERLIEAVELQTERLAPKDFMTDAQIIRRLGVPENIAYSRFHALDADPASLFPKKQKMWGDRRYWPAVKAYFEESTGFRLASRIGAARVAPENRTPHSAAAPPTPMRSASRRSQ
jgi:hypothetical protein